MYESPPGGIEPIEDAPPPATMGIIEGDLEPGESQEMNTTIRARFSGGNLKPLEPLALREGEEVTVTIASVSPEASANWLERTAGGWAGLIDAENLKRDIYESRLLATRPEPRL
jgi:predicted DNA-binding antitoxin AbrB/MazE fold protein